MKRNAKVWDEVTPNWLGQKRERASEGQLECDMNFSMCTHTLHEKFTRKHKLVDVWEIVKEIWGLRMTVRDPQRFQHSHAFLPVRNGHISPDERRRLLIPCFSPAREVCMWARYVLIFAESTKSGLYPEKDVCRLMVAIEKTGVLLRGKARLSSNNESLTRFNLRAVSRNRLFVPNLWVVSVSLCKVCRNVDCTNPYSMVLNVMSNATNASFPRIFRFESVTCMRGVQKLRISTLKTRERDLRQDSACLSPMKKNKWKHTVMLYSR